MSFLENSPFMEKQGKKRQKNSKIKKNRQNWKEKLSFRSFLGDFRGFLGVFHSIFGGRQNESF